MLLFIKKTMDHTLCKNLAIFEQQFFAMKILLKHTV